MSDSGSRPREAHLFGLALLAQFLWALNNSLAKIAAAAIPSVLLAGIRTILAALLILPIFLWRRPAIRRQDIWKLAALGVLGVGLNQFMFVVGVARTAVTHAGLVIPTAPILILILAAVLGTEKITAQKWIGMGLAFSGILVLQLSKQSTPGATLFGDALVFIGILSFASYIVFGKRVTANYDGIAVNSIAYIASALLVLPLTISRARGFDFSTVPATAWGALFYMAAFSSITGYMVYYYVLTHMNPSRISQFSYFQPIMTTSLAVIILGEPVTFALLVSGVLVLAGVWVAERRR